MAMGQQRIEYKTIDQMRTMHRSGLILDDALNQTVAAAAPGVTTGELDALFASLIKRAGATSNFLGYYDYPASICTSVNEEVVHGIPGARALQAGDVLSIDGGAIVEGWHSDSARTTIVGGPDAEDPQDRRLSDITEEGMWCGIAAMASGKYVGDIGNAIDDYVTSQPGQALGILEDYVGHGIGSAMHMAPDVLNYRARHRGPKLKPGMCLALEPMLVRGKLETKTLADDWTVVTLDKARAAHWEHSVALHAKGIWVLTAADGGAERLARYGVTPAPVG
ncbi:type I methionyl aminopeptidase [Arthrobacter sp. A2-55]|uniref:type I methionyl aminopeptidase n=1 Tax=Arthrobacter sp. A2-55 TaxID=2897337 RepID=UPI0021CDCDF8|nr:type I methionyl aminopeptidase [Arthrobacter sp. A2-55]MCU6479295.1 type I methionyl aminopeptidase [Arthrobacter sp. A2-55]